MDKYIQQFKRGALEMILLCLIGKKETYYQLNSKVATVSNSSYCIVKTDSLFNRTGAHSCDYYVNGSLEHRSTAVWPFDFTLPFH